MGGRGIRALLSRSQLRLAWLIATSYACNVAQPHHLPAGRNRPDLRYLLPLAVPAGHAAAEQVLHERPPQRLRRLDHLLRLLNSLINGVENRGDGSLFMEW